MATNGSCCQGPGYATPLVRTHIIRCHMRNKTIQPVFTWKHVANTQQRISEICQAHTPSWFNPCVLNVSSMCLMCRLCHGISRPGCMLTHWMASRVITTGNPTQEATKGPREKLLYVPCIVPDHSRPDYLATVDVDEASPTFGQVIYRTHLKEAGDEPHHSGTRNHFFCHSCVLLLHFNIQHNVSPNHIHTGWNSCSSCFGDATKQRQFLVLPCLGRPRVYGIDVATDPRAPKIAHVCICGVVCAQPRCHADLPCHTHMCVPCALALQIVEPEEIVSKTGLSYLHTSHCLGSGEIMVCSVYQFPQQL